MNFHNSITITLLAFALLAPNIQGGVVRRQRRLKRSKPGKKSKSKKAKKAKCFKGEDSKFRFILSAKSANDDNTSSDPDDGVDRTCSEIGDPLPQLVGDYDCFFQARCDREVVLVDDKGNGEFEDVEDDSLAKDFCCELCEGVEEKDCTSAD